MGESGGMSMEEFLGHSTRGGRGNVLKSWKEKGKILVWLSMRSGIHCVWRHNFKKIVELKDKPPDIWGDKFVCFETDPDVLVNRHRRDKEGNRLYAPTCGECRFLEDLYKEVKAKNLAWTDELFKFDAGKKMEKIHVGGAIGLFKGKDLSDDEKKDLRDHDIFLKEAWKEEMRTKAEYVFCVVNDEDPRGGVQVAVETESLGDKMKKEIFKQIKARGEKGDPTKHPYPFLWEFDDKADSFNDMYSVTAMTEEKPSPEILKLISAPPPDTSNITKGQSTAMVRTMMEQYCSLEVDWNLYFPPQKEADSKDKEGRAPEVGGKTEQAVAPPPDDDLVACDKCEKAMKATDTKCPHCGHVYVVEQAAAPPEPPPPPALKKRSEAAAEKVAPAAAPKAGTALDPTLFGGGGDDIPF